MWEKVIKYGTQIAALVAFSWGVYTYENTTAIKASTPYLEKKLEWCTEATETAALVASRNGDAPETELRFTQILYGVSGMIEKEHVMKSLIDFKDALERHQKNQQPNNQELLSCALAIGRACRKELAEDWSTSWERTDAIGKDPERCLNR